jgi:thiol-disulfide isomerase/thioredoxin
MSANVREIQQAEYEQAVLQAKGVAVLDFYSTECPPCEALAPKFEALADQFAGQIRFLKIFRQGNRELAQKLGVSGSPTLVFFRDGVEVGTRLTGEIKRSELKQRLSELVGGS